MGLQQIDPLPANRVAQRLSVTIWSAHEIAGVPANDLSHLLEAGKDEWSGFTLQVDARYLVVINPTQSARRRNSVVMHELAHIMLGHELIPAVITHGGHLVPTTYDQEQEDEAAWLGSTLLLPRPALLWMRRSGLSEESAATHFLVSLDLLSWRIRMTGIDYQLGFLPR